MFRCLASLALILVPALGWAGAWPRAEGATFVALSHSASSARNALGSGTFPQTGYSSLYVERGLRRLTLGLDAGRSDNGETAALVFVRLPMGRTGARNRFAVKSGVGAIDDSGGRDWEIYLGGDWGRGLETRFGDGWVGLETAAHYRISRRETVLKADLTFGLSVTGKTKLMLQLQTGAYPGSDPYMRLVPSAVRRIGPGAYVELGLEAGLVGDDNVGLKIGTWMEF